MFFVERFRVLKNQNLWVYFLEYILFSMLKLNGDIYEIDSWCIDRIFQCIEMFGTGSDKYYTLKLFNSWHDVSCQVAVYKRLFGEDR